MNLLINIFVIKILPTLYTSEGISFNSQRPLTTYFIETNNVHIPRHVPWDLDLPRNVLLLQLQLHHHHQYTLFATSLFLISRTAQLTQIHSIQQRIEGWIIQTGLDLPPVNNTPTKRSVASFHPNEPFRCDLSQCK